MTKVLIVGCGAIGLELTGVLSAQDHQVTGLKRKPPPTSAADLADLDTDFTQAFFYCFA